LYIPATRCDSLVLHRVDWLRLSRDQRAVLGRGRDSCSGTWKAYDDGDHAMCEVQIGDTLGYEFYVGYDTVRRTSQLRLAYPEGYGMEKCSTLYRAK